MIIYIRNCIIMSDLQFIHYMMHPMLNYSHSNPVDTPLKKLVKSISKPTKKDKRSIDNAENCEKL